MGIVPDQSLSYESSLDQDEEWAMSEGSRFFSERGAVHETLKRISQRLTEVGVPYAIVGGMALFRHGHRRFTEDVDILIEKTDLKKIHDNLTGLGYTPLFEGSKNLRDTQTRVKIEFLLSGGFPGDGKEKPVAFPSPASVAEPSGGIAYVNLASLIELKLASGMSGTDRMKDLSDVQELIKCLGLSLNFESSLHEYVRPKYRELWESTRGTPRLYMKLWRSKLLTPDVRSIDELIERLQQAGEPQAAGELKAMKTAGVTLSRAGNTTDNVVTLVTTDAEVASRFEMHDSSEFFGADEDGKMEL